MGKVWKPVGDGLLEDGKTRTRLMDNGKHIWQQDTLFNTDNHVWLRDGEALCRLVPDEGGVPVASIRICASYGMPLGITYAEYNAARDKVLNWLTQQQKGGE